MKKISIGVSVVFVLLLALGTFLKKEAIACEFLSLLSHDQLTNEIFLTHDISSEQSQQFKQIVSLASNRINEIYGGHISKPRILITSDINTAKNWGANETATMHRMPWRACIIVGPKGQNVDVLAHELLHAEIQYRVGFWRYLREIPVWFDEGAAVTVDYRASLLPDNIKLNATDVSSVQRLNSGLDFFSGNSKNNYQAARMAVIPMINADTFLQDLERIAHGESFETVFVNTQN